MLHLIGYPGLQFTISHPLQLKINCSGGFEGVLDANVRVAYSHFCTNTCVELIGFPYSYFIHTGIVYVSWHWYHLIITTKGFVGTLERF